MIGEIIGFDARLRGDLYLASEWPESRRSSLLLDPSVAWPLSVDTTVWPSVFEDPAATQIVTDPLAHLFISPDLTDYRQQAIGLWTSASELARKISISGASARTTCVSIELISEHGLGRDPDWRIRIGSVAFPVPSRVEWEVCGFDIADIGFVSGLSNCGWLPEDEQHLKSRWQPLLNRHGLFDDLGAARDFLVGVEDRAPEHAPFFVYRVRWSDWEEVAR